MRIAIIDDEKDARIVINSLVSKYILGKNTIYEADGVQTGVDLLSSTEIDLVFLDIQINDGTGFDLLNKLENKNFKLIFTTAYDEYAIKAFKYAAIDYLLKPIDPDDFKSAIKKVTQSLSMEEMNKRIKHLETMASENAFNKIACPTQNGVIYIEVKNITYLKSDGNYTFIYTRNNRRLIVCKLIREYEEMLPKNQFYRVHKSYIVNVKNINHVNNSKNVITLKSGKIIPIARRRKVFLKEVIG